MSRTTAKKPPTKPRPKKRKPGASAADIQAPPELEHPVVKATGYVVGVRVSHPKFGDGIVTAVEADKLTIRFKVGRERQIVDAYVKRRPR